VLLSPEKARGPLAALYLFNAEIARLREITREPLAGEMRIEWWREVITGSGENRPAGNPAAEALVETVARHDLPVSAFERYLEARLFDLYDDPMPDRAAFEAYAGETAATIIQLAALILDRGAAPAAANAAGHAGVAQAVAGTLLLMPRHRSRGQVYVPGDILAACGMDRETFLAAPGAGHAAAITAMTAYGREHLERARAAAASLPKTIFPAFLPVALVERVLVRADRRAPTPERLETLRPPQWRRQLRLLRAAATGRF